MLSALVLKIKRRETPFYDRLYRIIQSVRKGSIPCIPAIHRPLYEASRCARLALHQIHESLWAVPVFQSRVNSGGKNLHLPNGVPWVEGNVDIALGENVTLYRPTILTGHACDNPTLVIGENSTVGYLTAISVADRVEIGKDTMISYGCYIADNDGHPIDPVRRQNHEAVTADEVLPVKIGNNVWIGANCTILKGVDIGDNSIISPNSVVASNVLPNKVYMGNPARAVKALV